MKKIFFMLVSVVLIQAVYAQENDWANTGMYEKDNIETIQSGKTPIVVFMGNSITSNWGRFDPDFFTTNNFKCRGISGQVTSQMLVRFRSDVINLKPKAVVILAGINDIARNQGYISIEHIYENLVSMVQLAKANKIKVVLCTLVAADEIGWRKEILPKPLIKELNQKIINYAAANKIPVADMFTVTADENGGIKKEYRDERNDAVHPALSGYKAMEEEVFKALRAIKVIK